jgi:hypothetical protein
MKTFPSALCANEELVKAKQSRRRNEIEVKILIYTFQIS